MRVVDIRVWDVKELVQTVLWGLSPLVIEDVVDEGERIVVQARTPQGSVVCPVCGASSGRVHGYHSRTVADVPVDGRRVVVRVWARHLACPTRGRRQTFRGQMPGVLERYQRRTARLTQASQGCGQGVSGPGGITFAGGTRGGPLSPHSPRALPRIPLPTGRTPRVIGVDDFAPRRRHRYATVVIDAEPHERADALPDRTVDTLEARPREHPGVEAAGPA